MVREAEALEKAAAEDGSGEKNKPKTKEEIAEAMRKM